MDEASWWGGALGDGILDRGWGFRQGMGFQTGDGVPNSGWDTRHGRGSRHCMMVCQIGDRGVPGRGGVTTLTNHQSGILHSLIFNRYLYNENNSLQTTSFP